MLLDIYSVLNCELLANVSCNSFAKAIMTAHYKKAVVAANNMNAISHNNIVSLIEFKYGDDVMCVGYPAEYDKNQDKYIIYLDNVFVSLIEHDISNVVANSDYIYKAYNKTTAEANLLYSTIKSVLCSKVVREA